MVPQNRLTLSPSRLAWLAWAGVGIVLAFSLTLPAATFPGNNTWLRRFHTPEITPQRTFGQEFVMNRDGLNVIEFRPVRDGSRLAGHIELRLVDTSESGKAQVVRIGTDSAEELVRRSTYRYQFAPIENSSFRKYRFEFGGVDSSGVALLATKGNKYEGGTLTVNGRSRWADLVFQTSISTPPLSILRTLWTRRTQSGVSGKLVLALLVVSWVAIGLLFRALLSLPARTT